ncbi:MAG: APC family permease [Drouetiella hepatica Uher 2000/2452]|jgi:amino acid transporter|uniref:APC family permease n=1 Tax=Drouetiella hepatica Uher 2000/2452 TaxID=904376 RepID=A0A951UNU8_9CYAN|nr:APC family permease [Drouetiella hepatica Uher 2000/2452]
MSKGLKENALSIVDTITLAVAGTAPSYSLNATTAALVAAVGLASPGALLYAAIPMFGISFAFMHLNRWRADAGTAYAWVGRSLSPVLGFLCAWTFLVLSTAFMVAAALPVGVTTLDLIAPQYKENVLLATLAGGLWFVGVATLTILGVHVAAKFQRLMTAIEVIALLLLAIGAFIKFSAAPVHPFSWAWFSPMAFGNFQTFMAGMLVAMFYYFGWDVSSNVAEETSNSNSAPGSSGVLGMVGIFLLFLLLQVAIQMGLTAEQVEQHSADLLPALGNAIFPRPWGSIAILAVLVSTIGTIETQLTQCARTLFSMGRDRVIHEKFEEIHPHFQTPWLASLVITVLALFLMILSSTSASIGTVMQSLISSIGVMVSFYYGMTGLACAWYYRKTLRQDSKSLWLRGIWPVTSAVLLLLVGAFQLPQLGLEVSLMTVGAIAIGFIPLLYFRAKYRSAFYSAPAEYHNPQEEGELLEIS